jgi:hypothetical protein
MTENLLGDDVTSRTPWMIFSQHLQTWYDSPESAQWLKPGQVKIPFWLTPVKYYAGAAWYQRDIIIPPDWAGDVASLFLERTHWRTDVWIDDKAVGHNDSLSAPHEYKLGVLSTGRHRLTIRVDNRMQVNVGANAHSISDHTQSNWNGIVGKIELRLLPEVALTNVKVTPSARTGTVEVSATITAQKKTSASGRLQMVLFEKAGNTPQSPYVPVHFALDQATTVGVTADITLPGKVRPWDEFDPNLYEVRIFGEVDGGMKRTSIPSHVETFGFRDLDTSGTQVTLNGRPIFLRGTLESAIFPLTGYPPTDVGAWRRIMRICREHGLNHLRFHSWCPPEAAFQVADEEGFYLAVECASWTAVGDDPAYDEWMYEESRRIVEAYGNHPSFCMLLQGNEPKGKRSGKVLGEFVNYWKKRDGRHLYSGGAGWPMIPQNEFHITPKARIHPPRIGGKTRINIKPPETYTDYRDFVNATKAPVITHEIGQWCVYPNLEERKKYTGVLRAYNFDIFAKTLADNHMADQAQDFLMASGKLQALCYKEEIESALRTPGLGGFQLLDLHDFPGQGTALVGVLDPFWDSKGYISAEEYRQFAGPVVPLARLAKRVFTNDENLTATIDLANFGRGNLNAANVRWHVSDTDNNLIGRGSFLAGILPVGNTMPVGEIGLDLGTVTTAGKLILEVTVDGTDARNRWDIWVYPTQIDTAAPAGVTIAHKLDQSVLDKLTAGEKVLLLPPPADIVGTTSGPIVAGFSSIFWNTAWFKNEPPETLGILCDPLHPALAKFPTEFHSNWQWWYLIHESSVMLLDGLPGELRPLVQMIDDWHVNRRLGYIFEAKLGDGKLLVCSFQIGDAANPVAKQMLKGLLDYMSSDNFAPAHELTEAHLEKVVRLVR